MANAAQLYKNCFIYYTLANLSACRAAETFVKNQIDIDIDLLIKNIAIDCNRIQ